VLPLGRHHTIPRGSTRTGFDDSGVNVAETPHRVNCGLCLHVVGSLGGADAQRRQESVEVSCVGDTHRNHFWNLFSVDGVEVCEARSCQLVFCHYAFVGSAFQLFQRRRDEETSVFGNGCRF
jgi:hypothetical protein